MITLYTFGPMLGLPDPSPFVMKAELLLKIAGLPYSTDTGGFGKAPKGKLPYIRDGDAVIGDSTLIRWHLERVRGIDFDAGYGPADTALGWAVEKMLEEHLYWAISDLRWMDDANFEKGPAHFFDAVPAPVRPIVKAMVRRQIRGRLKAHGLGRHAKPDREALAIRSIDALAMLLADKPFLLGDRVSGYDATAYAFVAGILCPHFESPLVQAAQAHANLVAYDARMRARYYQDDVAAAAKA